MSGEERRGVMSEEADLSRSLCVMHPVKPLHTVAHLTAHEGAWQRELRAYVVEACTECRWHHLLRVLPL